MEGNESTETVVRVGDVFMTNFSGLLADTTYVVGVAGENRDLVGEYGNLTISTPQS